MILKSAMIAVGVMGLMYGGPALAASSFICAAYAFCNATAQECNMIGNINNLFYRDYSYFYKNISCVVPFFGAFSPSVLGAQVDCGYNNQTFSDAFTFFRSNGDIRLYPDTTVKNKWVISNDAATCQKTNETENFSSKDCPLTTTPPALRA